MTCLCRRASETSVSSVPPSPTSEIRPHSAMCPMAVDLPGRVPEQSIAVEAPALR
ncbi:MULTISPECIES: hypothetical protein [unclassified Streptomyces]|uniref:hypothetical protein n=1 Tax=unclassified Streptomyces TaxID=2593676 RepID=UPI00081B36E1|nr:hypothetical protein [Streptomyces sp. BvitLS-983]SCD39762.1 hypothetical protein GA0115250_105918 [Streptomyces sp. BvitLS-983]